MRTSLGIRAAVLALVSALAVSLGACDGGGGHGGGFAAGSAAGSAAGGGSLATPANPSGAAGRTVTLGGCRFRVPEDEQVAPTVTISSCARPPETLQEADIVEGSGRQIDQGMSVTVRYVGIAWSTRTTFDTSWTRNPDTFTVPRLGDGQIIRGWEIGLAGARPGARRLLVIPPDMAYGTQGYGSVKPDETLVYVIDVVGATGAEGGGGVRTG